MGSVKDNDASRARGNTGTLRVSRRQIVLSNTDKVFFPDSGITKGDVIDYYRRIAEHMLPYLENRPLAIQRFPDGIDGDGFYQKNRPEHFPEWIASVPVKTEEGTHTHVACRDAATLVYLANQASITFHAWLSRRDSLRQPDQLVFDLDPAGDDFDSVRFAARTMRELLEDLECTGYCKTTGSRGLHVVVPINRGPDFDRTRELARDIAGLAATREPRRLTIESRKKARKGRLFLDYLRNGYAQHAVVSYSLRALPGAPIAMPLAWREVEDDELDARSWHIGNVFDRIGRREDPWKGWRRHAVSAVALRRRLDGLGGQKT